MGWENIKFWAEMIGMTLALPIILLFWCLFFGVMFITVSIVAGFVLVQLWGDGYFTRQRELQSAS